MMERFVIGAALLTAGAFAAVALFGADSFQFHINVDDERGGLSSPVTVGETGGAPIASTPYAATSLEIEDAAAILRVIPEDRTDIAIAVSGGERLPKLVARLSNGVLVLDGGLDNSIRDCEGGRRVSIRGVGEVGEAELPVITARTPRDVNLEVGSAVFADVGATKSLTMASSGCGDLKLGAVEGALKLSISGDANDVVGASAGALTLSQAGSADVRLDGVRGAAEVSIAGAGDTVLGAIGQGLEVAIAGSGDLKAASVSGPLKVSIAGSGDVEVGGGRPTPVEVSVAGSGGVRVEGAVGDLSASIMGSGDVSVGAVEGRRETSVMGSGDIRIGG